MVKIGFVPYFDLILEIMTVNWTRVCFLVNLNRGSHAQIWDSAQLPRWSIILCIYALNDSDCCLSAPP